jgi:hypothetical protein
MAKKLSGYLPNITTLAKYGVAASLGLAAAYYSAAASIANIVQSANPDLALRMVPGNSAALAAKADGLLLKNGAAMNESRVAKLANSALKTQPLNARALRLSAFAADKQNNAVAAKSFMRLSNAVSRRDFGAQLWLIEDAVRNDDIPKALVHYDNAMRTRTESHELLFPVLTQALEVPEVRTEMVKKIRNRPPWLYDFLNYAIVSGKQPQHISDVLQRAKGMPNTPQYNALEGVLIGNLIERATPEAARAYTLSLRGFDPKTLGETGFNNKYVNAIRFPATWWGISSENIEGEFIQRTGGQFDLFVSSASGERGIVARKLLYLPPGQYRTNPAFVDQSLPQGAELVIQIRCLNDGSIMPMWVQSYNSKSTVSQANISSTCSAQYLDVEMINTNDRENAEVTISAIPIERVSE